MQSKREKMKDIKMKGRTALSKQTQPTKVAQEALLSKKEGIRPMGRIYCIHTHTNQFKLIIHDFTQ